MTMSRVPQAENGGFDPMRDLFVAQSSKPPQLAEVNLRTLTPFQRALLVIDGTVTKFIEAYTMERVEVIRLDQAVRTLPVDHPWLEAAQGTAVIARQVLLQGQRSQTIYAYAGSLIVPDRIQEIMREKLSLDGESIGRILSDNRVETYRDILWYGRERVGELPSAIRHLENKEFISRTYRIIVGTKPVMLINERFPLHSDTTLSPD